LKGTGGFCFEGLGLKGFALGDVAEGRGEEGESSRCGQTDPSGTDFCGLILTVVFDWYGLPSEGIPTQK